MESKKTLVINFSLKNRRLRLYTRTSTLKIRDINRYGEETATGRLWKEIKFHYRSGYLRCSISLDGVCKKLTKHRLVYYAYNPEWDIFDTSMNNMIDHKNNQRTDNRITNMRVVNNQQNNFNRSNVKGYYWDKRVNKWRACIVINNKRKHLGYYLEEEDAHNAYLKGKAKYHLFN